MINNINDGPKVFRDTCEFNELLPIITLTSRRVSKDISDLNVLKVSKGADTVKINNMINNLCIRWMNKMRRLGVYPVNITHRGFIIKYYLPDTHVVVDIKF